jgi:hypothetical protein
MAKCGECGCEGGHYGSCSQVPEEMKAVFAEVDRDADDRRARRFASAAVAATGRGPLSNEEVEDAMNRPVLCSVGSCQRHGRCMYLNHPRCGLAGARARVRAVARGGTINGTYGLSPEPALDAFRADLLLIVGDE